MCLETNVRVLYDDGRFIKVIRLIKSSMRVQNKKIFTKEILK